ncbi:MAG: T9SS type A sorting domain-containing protein [Hymenobacter sp.]|nr:MAG: T9SS type A sorting domain-containing protein [Hymenobacter sp.]
MRFSTTVLVLYTLLAGLPGWATTHGCAAKTSRPQIATLATYRPAQVAPTLNIFPNPSRGQMTVQLTGLAGQEYKLRLANILGREVRLLALRPEQASEGLAVDLTGLPAGMYFYSLLLNDKIVATKRLTLQGD